MKILELEIQKEKEENEYQQLINYIILGGWRWSWLILFSSAARKRRKQRTGVSAERGGDFVIEREITEADQILNELHKGIRKVLKQDQSENQDGMDMSLLVIDRESYIIVDYRTFVFIGTAKVLISSFILFLL